MKFSQYSDIAASTAIYPEKDTGSVMALAYCALGLGEAGEVQGKVKKILRDDDGQIADARAEQILSECGDVLWYLDRLAAELGSSLEEVANANLDKLLTRQVNGTLHGSGDAR